MNLNSESRRANENICFIYFLSIVDLQCSDRKYLVLRWGRESERAKNHWLSDSQVLLGWLNGGLYLPTFLLDHSSDRPILILGEVTEHRLSPARLPQQVTLMDTKWRGSFFAPSVTLPSKWRPRLSWVAGSAPHLVLQPLALQEGSCFYPGIPRAWFSKCPSYRFPLAWWLQAQCTFFPPVIFTRCLPCAWQSRNWIMSHFTPAQEKLKIQVHR